MQRRPGLACGLLVLCMGLSACGGGGNGDSGGSDSGNDVGGGAGTGSGGTEGGGSGGGSSGGGDGSAACGNGSGDIRVLNAIASSVAIEVKVPETSTDFGTLAFGTASGFLDTPTCSYKIPVGLTDSTGKQTLYVPDVQVRPDAQTTLFVTGLSAAEDSVGFAVVEPVLAVPDGQVEVQLVHVASASPSLNVYALPPGATSVDQGTQLTKAFGEQGFQHTAYSTPTNVAAGSYRLVVTTVDGEQVYDSGPAGIALPTAHGARSYQIAVLDAPDAPNGSSISLLLLDDSGAQTALANGQH
jgi:hypothetical protein